MPLKDKIKKFPDAPGVYFWLGKNKKILYIGRATSLRKRVAQYLRADLDPRIAEMVGKARSIRYKKTDTILDAVILEANEIKKHWPKYNVRDRDDRSFVYVVIPKKDFSYPIVVRERELQKFPAGKNKIFGPYPNAGLAKNALKIIRRIFPYGTCRPNSGQPCFDRQIGLCPGGCVGDISAAEYQKNISAIIAILSGGKKRLIKKMARENPDRAVALQHISDVSLITRGEIENFRPANRIECYDISHLAGRETYGAMSVFVAGRPDKSQYRLFKIKTAPAGDDLRALAEVITRRFGHPEWPLPDLLVIDGGKPQIDFVAKTMADKNFSVPIVGISKFAGDRLIFPAGAKKSFRDLAQSAKIVLLQARDEAHRFGNKASRKLRAKI